MPVSIVTYAVTNMQFIVVMLYQFPLKIKLSNGRNHWMLRQLTRSTKVDPWPGAKVLFAATSDRLPSHPAKKVGEPQTAVSPLLGLVSVAY